MVAACYSLREKNYARTKVGLMNAFMERLKTKRFDDISIKEVCQAVEVAEGTFFNYFPEKIDVIVYFLHLLITKMIWRAKQDVPQGKYLALIESVFGRMAEMMISVHVFYQITSVLLVQSEQLKKGEISGLEKRMAFPDQAGIEDSPTKSMGSWLKECLAAAKKSGELPPKTNINDIYISLMTILSGTLIATKFGDAKSRGYHYKRQLCDLWRVSGARAQYK